MLSDLVRNHGHPLLRPVTTIWLNSVGISFVIDIALMLSVNGSSARADPWQTFRLFLMPFCVSSFAALIKDRGFVLIFPPTSATTSWHSPHALRLSASSC